MIPLGIAAGMLKKPADLEPILRLDPTICRYITMGSFTTEAREGNVGNRLFWGSEHASLNALGLPNPGIDSINPYMWELAERLYNEKRPLRISVAGFSVEQYAHLAEAIRSFRFVRYIELNLGCPNVRDGGVQERIMSFDPEQIDQVLHAVWKKLDTIGPEIDIKLSPYSDPHLLKEVASVVAGHSCPVAHVVTSNTFPNASGYGDDRLPLIDVNRGYAGMSGRAMKHIALGQVGQFRDALPETIKIIGVGGISSGQDVRDMELAGAASVQVGTAFFKNGDPGVIQRIVAEYAELAP